MTKLSRKISGMLLGLVCGTFSMFSQSNVIDEVIAVIGDTPVLLSDVEMQYQQAVIQGADYQGDLKCHIFEQLMIQNLLIEQAKLDSIEVSENMVIMQVDRMINEFINRAGSREKLEEWLNKPLYQIKNDQRVLVRNQMITQEMQRSITSGVKVTPAEIRAFYRTTNTDSLPMVPTQYEIQQIRINPEIDLEEIEAVKARLREFQRQVAEGRDFATLAVLYSEDPGSAARGGELGFMSRAELVPEFAQVAFNMQEAGRVSKIVETEFGFHIIQLIERQGDRANVRHILLKPKPKPAAIEAARLKADSIANLIRNDSVSFEEATLLYSFDKDTKLTGGLMVNPQDNSTKFDIQMIPPAINRQLEKMDVGDISGAFLMKDERYGKDYYAIIKLKSRVEAHKANLTDDYQLIQTILENKKREELFKKWITDKQRDNYISISPKWSGCSFEFKGWIK
ncbi:peptidylprolyl isomerase [Xiashengella succiniciproducens]|mgnify:FL=1|uniref:Peptidylprolyl isomerase n=1 Tax=Xiashengella succiniciproducens TaxID=2949635 RepID=A0A9J6ZMR0_9BACT|nr:peptidylprolyl isomerase [Alkaliflexus sp. Ai-910]URW79164.1 peptidylprolyl isomerase [Alkaliflexus sp. Ai-910]